MSAHNAGVRRVERMVALLIDGLRPALAQIVG
jgi:hypothetical protein